MLISYIEIVKKYGSPKGIIHLGAHLAEELEAYLENGNQNVIWVEANPHLFDNLKQRLINTEHKAFSYLLSDVDDVEMKFNIAKNYYNGNYQSSSVLDFGTHEIDHPHIKMEDSIILKSKTINSIFRDNNLNFDNYDFVNLDLQGYELPVIKGFGKNITKIKYIYTEVNIGEVYKGCSKLNEIDEYLSQYGFHRVETVMTDANWGDALYINPSQSSKKIIFDIGSNVGNFTDACLANYVDCEIVLVEPNNELIDFLKSKYSNLKNLHFVNKVVSEKSGELIDFYISNTDTISTASKDWIKNSRFSGNYNLSKVIQKETINLDGLIDIYGHPLVIKIDVEGYEYEVIKGLSKKQNELCFEWTEEQFEKVNQTCNALKKIGYTNFGYIYGDNHLERPLNYTTWEQSDIHNDILPEGKERWGMIWVK